MHPLITAENVIVVIHRNVQHDLVVIIPNSGELQFYASSCVFKQCDIQCSTNIGKRSGGSPLLGSVSDTVLAKMCPFAQSVGFRIHHGSMVQVLNIC